MGRNFYDSNFARSSDSEWYARTRFRPDFEFAVGRVKAVLGIEIDLQYGRAGPTTAGFRGTTPACRAARGARVSHGRLQGQRKRLSRPQHRRRRHARGQVDLHRVSPDRQGQHHAVHPGRDHRSGRRSALRHPRHLQAASFAASDFAGISTVTTFAPNLRSNLTWVIVEDQLAGANRGNPIAEDGPRRGLFAHLRPRVLAVQGAGPEAPVLLVSRRRHHVDCGADAIWSTSAPPGESTATGRRWPRPLALLPPVAPRTTRIATRWVSMHAGGSAPSASTRRSSTSGVG